MYFPLTINIYLKKFNLRDSPLQYQSVAFKQHKPMLIRRGIFKTEYNYVPIVDTISPIKCSIERRAYTNCLSLQLQLQLQLLLKYKHSYHYSLAKTWLLIDFRSVLRCIKPSCSSLLKYTLYQIITNVKLIKPFKKQEFVYRSDDQLSLQLPIF